MTTVVELEKVPARILLQVREGVYNLLSEFELDIQAGESEPQEDGTTNHKVPIDSILDGIYGAAAGLAENLIRKAKLEKREAWLEWLGQMGEYVVEVASEAGE